MSVNSKMTAIADAIRAKTGKSGVLTLDAMAEEVSSLSVEEIIQHADIPDYVKSEALRVANAVENVRQSDSIVFLAMSDNHHAANSGQTDTSNMHAAMAAKILAYALRFDFTAQLGDITAGTAQNTSAALHAQAAGFMSFLREFHKDIPCFHAIGNHDTGIYSYNAGLSGGGVESGSWLYDNFTAHSASNNTVFGGQANGGYCYRDFADKKLRVFLLNTSEALVVNKTDYATLGSQRKWFADALTNLNNKTDAASWSFIVLSHYPADYGNTMPLSELLKAYVEGKSITITLESGSNATVNFSGKNSAKMIAQFHGHVHNFLSSKLYSYSTGKGVQYDAWRICIPNGEYNRENTYTTVGSYTDISFAEATSYSKTPNSAKDTSFVVNVVNPSEQKIYSLCYGAGIDRVIGYAATVYYSITANLTNVTLTGGATNVEAKQPYTAILSIASGYEWKSVKITMGGTDITSSVYSNGAINIPSVTGNVVITATAAAKQLYVNQIPISTGTDGNPISDTGYIANTYLSSSTGLETYNWDWECTGFIPCKKGDIVRLKNMAFSKTSSSGSNRLAFYDANRAFLKMYNAGATYDTQAVVGDDGNWTQFTVPAAAGNVAYCRLTCNGITTSSIITVNQEIV